MTISYELYPCRDGTCKLEQCNQEIIFSYSQPFDKETGEWDNLSGVFSLKSFQKGLRTYEEKQEVEIKEGDYSMGIKKDEQGIHIHFRDSNSRAVNIEFLANYLTDEKLFSLVNQT